ncbi:unnamed protein product (macronuclear) [Paramecium tetraurelia]|uniref:Centrosomal protein of 162 kDa n=1 Tax=Paramecium tetraurelia TaxID=5888 RepID=A0EFH1_PARTE|nr:uncharacterized protein GSPATT00026385001 [Paramecium tetraurelia]CAK94062.1 unnamed protein product [Paramecium tetraurelia]|eukprot:XP_001461435.1 hypothetical protein (macronuclear) [Paramecium tetraurelia strain d4-2]
MHQREQRITQRAFSSTSPTTPTMSNAYASAMKNMQDKLKQDGIRKSVDISPQDIIIEHLKQQISELSGEKERLQFQLSKIQQELEMNNKASQQIEQLQVERLQHLKDYQDRVSELIRKNEELKHDKHELQSSNEYLQRQLYAYKNNEKGLIHKAELKKFEENSALLNTIQDYKQKLEYKDSMISNLETRIDYLDKELQRIQNEYENYKLQHPQIRLNDFEKQINNLRYQLDEKDRVYYKSIDEVQTNRICREEQMAKRIQELVVKSLEYQDIIQQLTLDYKDLNMKYQSIRIKFDQEERNQRYLKQDFDESYVNQGYKNQKTLNKLNLDQILPAYFSPRVNENTRQSQLKQVIRDCLEDMKNTGQSPEKKNVARKRLTSPISPQQQNEIEIKLKFLNERYETLIRQAQQENDMKSKANIRKQLLEIAEQIKEATKINKNI